MLLLLSLLLSGALSQSPICTLHMDGDPNDATGTYSTSVDQGTATYVAGAVGQAFSFDGQSRIEIQFNGAVSETDFGISVWTKTTNGGGIFCIDYQGHDRHFGVVGTDVKTRTWPHGTTTAPANANDNAWHNLIYTFGPTAGETIFMDGSQISNEPAKTKSNYNWDKHGYVGWSTDYKYFDGLMDEVNIFNTELTAANAAALSNPGNPAPTPRGQNTQVLDLGNVFDTSHSGWEQKGAMDITTDGIAALECTTSYFIDQNWGNYKGYVRAALIDAKGHHIATHDCFGRAPRPALVNGKSSISPFDDIITMSRAGMKLALETHVGSGGGHTLTVNDLKLTATLPHATTMNVGDVRDNSHNSWEQKQSLTLALPIVQVDCKAKNFYDQGWGYQKSRVRIALYDVQGNLKAAQDCFGVAPHTAAGPVSATFSDIPLTWLGVPGDKLAVETVVGGGGGHMIYVDALQAVVSYGRLRVEHEVLGPLNIADMSHDNWESKAQVTLRATAREISCDASMFRDQSWGNQKSQVRLALYAADGSLVASEDCFGVAPHDCASVPVGHSNAGCITAGAVSNSFTDTILVWQATAGDVLKLETYVGGGGGHELHATDLTATVTYGVPSEFCGIYADDPNWVSSCADLAQYGLCSDPIFGPPCRNTCCFNEFLFARAG